MKANKFFRGPFFWITVAITLVLLGSNVISSSTAPETITTSQAVLAIQKDQVQSVKLIDRDQRIELTFKDGKKAKADFITGQGVVLQELLQAKVERGLIAQDGYDTVVPKENFLVNLLFTLLPIALVIFLLFFFMGQMQGGNRVLNFGKAKARAINKDMPKTTFADVAGADEAVEELQEIKEFLSEPSKFQAVGAKIPKGVLLYGPPGTGKTLLARAVAGEAGVPFFSISGSDFVEMFVGVGASRVRDLFEQAKQAAPAIIFVDEIDAVGRQRGAGLGGGHDEREQTLNQLLVEMDGFETNDGVILIAATNRPDVLDPALLRPGRFDRQVVVSNPDIIGREAILKVHLKKITTGPDVNPKVIARGTPGFSGADLANIVNESALLAARKNKRIVTMSDLEEAKDKVMMGAERRSMVMTDEEKTLTAYHEGGHAVVALYEQTSDPIHKATIIPRGRALGMVMRLPERDQLSVTREKMYGDISVAMGGRIAEEMIFGYDKVTSGASSDIEMVTKMAKNMVTRYGMSDQLGPIAYQENEEEVFLGRSVSRQQNVSEETAKKIDAEVKKIVESGYTRAKKILSEKIDELHKVAKALLTYETLSGEEIKKIVFENVYPKRLSEKEEASTTKKKLGSALGAIGLKPNPQS